MDNKDTSEILQSLRLTIDQARNVVYYATHPTPVGHTPPPGREHLKWKESTHRWICPEEGCEEQHFHTDPRNNQEQRNVSPVSDEDKPSKSVIDELKEDNPARHSGKAPESGSRVAGSKWIRKDKRLAIYMRDGFTCAYCGSNMKDDTALLTLDHLIPVEHGGSNDQTNLITACHQCNSVRGSRDLRQFCKDVGQYLDIEGNFIEKDIMQKSARNIDRNSAKELISRYGKYGDALKEASLMGPSSRFVGTIRGDSWENGR